MQVQQEQEPERPQKRKQHLKRLPWKRLTAFIFTVLLIAVGAVFWILNSLSFIQGPWVAILTALFVACGIVVGLLQWLFPVSFHKPEPSTASIPQPTNYCAHSSIPTSLPTIPSSSIDLSRSRWDLPTGRSHEHISSRARIK